jgi:spermidine/putrescine transport system permease protein
LTVEGISTGFFLVYVISFGEYAIPSLLAGQKQYYVGTLISEYFFIGKDWHVGAAFTLLSLVFFLSSVLVYQKLLRYVVHRLQRV